MEHGSHLILCVDDEVIGLQVHRNSTGTGRYRVVTAQDGLEGLEVFEKEPVEAVVLDISMPGMHGGEVARQDAPGKTARDSILLLSAYVGLPVDVTSVVDLYMTKG